MKQKPQKKMLLCDTNTMYPRLRSLGIRKPLYLWAFQELIISLKGDNGIVRDSDLALWWPNISDSTRYQILRIFVFYKVIKIEKNLEDKRERYISILIKYQDTLYTINL
jgi:hypothetical protein